MANNVDAKFAAAFSSTQATAAQKSGRYASYLADRVNAILSCVVLIDWRWVLGLSNQLLD